MLKKVITYGTFDMIHQGHLNILKRAKVLGDYLIVGVTSDDFDSRRGKINVQQSMMERVEGVKETGLADQIIIEEYEGQKIDDINRLGVDVFAIGSDWKGNLTTCQNSARLCILSVPREYQARRSGRSIITLIWDLWVM